MLTKICIRNFKRFDNVDLELGKTVVFIGPNNSGKTTALQALAFWSIGLKRWTEKRGRLQSEEQPGVAINRHDLIAIPVPESNLLWKDLHVHQNTRIEIVVDGVSEDRNWTCGLEFEYANEESFYCRPLQTVSPGDDKIRRMPIPPGLDNLSVAFLPPMSGLADREYYKQTGEINVLIGQGQTAQVLRNLCFQLYENDKLKPKWSELNKHISRLFGISLASPRIIKERSEIIMTYREINGNELDLSSSGRGLQQTILLLAHLYLNPKTVLLLDEPDAHLEVLRQRQIYQLLTEVATEQGSQVIIASHSEVVLNEAADRDIVIAFVGRPHRIDDRGSQVLKSLKEIGYEQYYLAEQCGWVLYLEGSTDLAILKAFAEMLNHPAARLLDKPFVHYVGNKPQKARDHFYGIQEAYPELVGMALFDRLMDSKDRERLSENGSLREVMWRRREIENYLCYEDVLLSYARYQKFWNDCFEQDDLFGSVEMERRETIMRETIVAISSALKTLRRIEPWSIDTKVTDDFLDPLFEQYFSKLELPNLLRKTDYHVLAQWVPLSKIDSEIVEKLDLIVQVAEKAKSVD